MIRHRYKRRLAGAAARAFGLIIIIIIAIAAVFIIVMAFSDTGASALANAITRRAPAPNLLCALRFLSRPASLLTN
jgi:hypothetical protein